MLRCDRSNRISPGVGHGHNKEAGLTQKILHKLMAERDEQRCGDWKDLIVQEFLPDGSQLVFVDETSKNELTWACCFGRAPSGCHVELTDVFVHGDCYSMVAAVTTEGYLAADVVKGSYDSELFNLFISEKVVCQSSFYCDMYLIIYLSASSYEAFSSGTVGSNT